MPDDADIYNTAHSYIAEFGAHAPIHAAMKADDLFARGDLDGAQAYRVIVGAINEILQPRHTVH